MALFLREATSACMYICAGYSGVLYSRLFGAAMRRNMSGPALDKVVVSTYPAVSVLHASVGLHVCAFILPILYFYFTTAFIVSGYLLALLD